MKVCTKCNISKPLTEFSKAKKEKDGLQYKCKDCNKQHNKDNKESRKQYNQDNKEFYRRIIAKQYYQDNKECI